MSDRWIVAFLLVIEIFVIYVGSSDGDSRRIGRRQKGDTILYKNSVCSDATQEYVSILNVSHEYVATEPVTCIDYQANVETESEIVFTSEQSLEATFHSVQNVTKLLVTITVFGYHLQFIPNDTATILWNAAFLRADDYELFSVGEREYGDDEIFFSAKRTAVTPSKQNHSIEFDVAFEMYITFVEIMSKSANAIFSLVTEHTFRGFIYDASTRALHAKLTIYGFVPNKLPSNYSGYFAAATTATAAPAQASPTNDVAQNGVQPLLLQPMPILLNANGAPALGNLNRITFLPLACVLYAYARSWCGKK